MVGMEPVDEFTDIDLTEDEIDAMMAAGEPVELVAPPPRFQPVPPAPPLLEVAARSRTYGSRPYVRQVGRPAKSAHRLSELAILS